jgi:hypothetical protein
MSTAERLGAISVMETESDESYDEASTNTGLVAELTTQVVDCIGCDIEDMKTSPDSTYEEPLTASPESIVALTLKAMQYANNDE